MDKSNIRPLSQAAAKGKTKTSNADFKLSDEIKKHLVNIANSIKKDAYAGLGSDKIITKCLTEIEILRNKVGGGAL